MTAGILWLLLTSRQSGAAVTAAEPTRKVRITPVMEVVEPAPPEPPRTSMRAAARPVVPARLRVGSPASSSTRPSARPEPPSTAVRQPLRVAPSQPVPSLPAPSRPLVEEPDYPTAATAAAPARPASPPRSSPRPFRRETAPLWDGEESSTSDAERSTSGTPGQGDSRGLIVDARPKGRVKLQTPAFMKLVKAKVVARFQISKEGRTESVTLDLGTGIAATDAEILAFLTTVEWSPKTISGVAVSDVQVMTFSRTESSR